MLSPIWFWSRSRYKTWAAFLNQQPHNQLTDMPSPWQRLCHQHFCFVTKWEKMRSSLKCHQAAKAVGGARRWSQQNPCESEQSIWSTLENTAHTNTHNEQKELRYCPQILFVVISFFLICALKVLKKTCSTSDQSHNMVPVFSLCCHASETFASALLVCKRLPSHHRRLWCSCW